jgi:putative DNA primase/helicase
MNLNIFPDGLCGAAQWICWRYEERDNTKPAKIPIDPKTGRSIDVSNSDAGTHLAHAICYHSKGHPIGNPNTIERNTDGIGFVFTESDPFVGIDLDDCITSSNELEPWARDVAEQLNTYTEYSPSGGGVHCLCKGELPSGNARNDKVELYEDSRFFTVTAEPLSDFPQPEALPSRTDELASIWIKRRSRAEKSTHRWGE